jgi:hypothetical protein
LEIHRWLRASGVITVFLAGTAIASQPIANCSNPKGYSFYHYAGVVPKDKSGFLEDQISGGLTTLQILSDGEYDVLMIDARKQVISMRNDGGRIVLLRKGSNDATFPVVFPGKVIELYSFYREQDGTARFDILSSKGGDGMPIPKSSVMSGRCSQLDLTLIQ